MIKEIISVNLDPSEMDQIVWTIYSKHFVTKHEAFDSREKLESQSDHIYSTLPTYDNVTVTEFLCGKFSISSSSLASREPLGSQ